MRNVLEQSFRENQNKRFVVINISRKSCYLWDNVEKYSTARHAKDDNIIRHPRLTYCINKATDTLRICDTYCFPRQLYLRERASTLSYTYVPALLYIILRSYTAASVNGVS
jgi:hypothetical protein